MITIHAEKISFFNFSLCFPIVGRRTNICVEAYGRGKEQLVQWGGGGCNHTAQCGSRAIISWTNDKNCCSKWVQVPTIRWITYKSFLTNSSFYWTTGQVLILFEQHEHRCGKQHKTIHNSRETELKGIVQQKLIGSKLGSNDRHCYSFVVLDIIFNF